MEVSHRTQAYDLDERPKQQRGPDSRLWKLNATVPQTSQTLASTSKKPVVAWQQLSTSSSVSPRPLSPKLGEETVMTASKRSRPSALPRSTGNSSGPRLRSVTSPRSNSTSTTQVRAKTYKLEPFYGANDTQMCPPATLRRKHTIIQAPSADFSEDYPKSSFDIETESSLGFPYERQHSIDPSDATSNKYARSQQDMELPPGLIPELQALAVSHAKSNTAPGYSKGSVSSPSTQFTQSSDPWSSRNTTPTSMSSFSPGIVEPLRVNQSARRSNTAPLPANTRSRAHHLPVLQEALTSSSSRKAGKNHVAANRQQMQQQQQQVPFTPKKQKKPRIETMEGPTPPPRSASVKRNKIAEVVVSKADYVRDSDDRRDRYSNDLENSPLAKRKSGALDIMGNSQTSSIRLTNTGEQATGLQSKPVRPSRSQIISLEPRHPVHLKSNFEAYNAQSRKGEQIVQFSRREDTAGPQLPHKQSNNKREKISQESTHVPSTTKPLLSFSERGGPPPYASPDDFRSLQAHALAPSRTRTPGKLARLGAFIRGKKTPEPDPPKTVPRKLQRKGPTAGTGHEGYGKYAKHSKKYSLSSGTVDSQHSTSAVEKVPSRPGSAKTSRSTSTRRDSKIRTSQSDIDEFVAQRLKPIQIVGGSKRSSGHQQDTGSTTEPGTYAIQASDDNGLPFVDSFSSKDEGAARGLLAQENGVSPEFAHLQQPLQAQRVHGSDTKAEVDPSAHFQKSLPYLRQTETPRSVSSTSHVSSPAHGQSVHRVDEALFKKPDKKGRKLKWNIFSRNHSSSKIAADAPVPVIAPTPEMLVRISTIPAPRPVPYYAMMESESENNVSDVGDYLRQAAQSSPRQHTEEPWMHPPQAIRRAPSTLLPSPPLFSDQLDNTYRPPQSEAELREETQTVPPLIEPTSGRRPQRLAQVGRIPRVVSRKDRRHTPNSHSFSRPFQAGGEDQSPQLIVDSEAERPQLEIHTELLPARPFTEVDSGKPASAPAQMLSSTRDLGIAFSQEHTVPIERQVSQLSTSTSSEGMAYVSAPVHTLRHAAERLFSRYTGEDEVWNEYDDFIDHVMSPSKSKSQGKENENVLAEQAASLSPLSPPGQLQNLQSNFSTEAKDTSIVTQTPAIVFPAATLDESRLSSDIRLRRSRIVAALHSSIDPSSPFSVARFFAGYGKGNKGSAEQLSLSHQGTLALRPTSLNLATADQSSRGSTSQPEVVLFDVVEKEHYAAADNELHYASLMISRWLSFGRVLFSPAQDEVFNNADKHILILDGLRNEDFSYYCCVSYRKALVHSLKEADPHRRRPSDSGHAPPNYRVAEVSSFGEKFPFPPSFFSVAVLRFLPAMSDRNLQNLIAETKRVLTPGGHLELMLLDLDIVNMGTNTRRAIREMKIKMTSNDSSISLKPISDNVQGILGRKGFANLNRCVVGVPVAGKIAGSMDSSSSSRSSGGSYAQQQRSSQEIHGVGAHRATNPYFGENFSLNDLISDHTPGSDEKIAKIVSKTARFWYSHCYEPHVNRAVKTSRSVLSDRKVMNECKMRASSFKLFIAHAQKPSDFKRRTVSEPVLPILATAGSRPGRRDVP